MPIFLDVSAAVHSKAGIGRYAESLARALIAREPRRFSLFYNRGPHTLPPAGLEAVPACTLRAGYKPWRMAVWMGQLVRVPFNRLVPGAELFHATEHLLPPLRDIPTVLTVHDMIFKLFPEHQKSLNYWYLNATMPMYCRRAHAIITVSESSKRDIVAHYDIAPERVTVVYEAAAPEFLCGSQAAMEHARKRYALPEHFLIHVGTIEPRKNLSRLIEALHLLRERGLEIPLVVVGAKGWLYNQLFRRLKELEIGDNILFPGYVAANDLPALYSAATAAVMPSVYEGFGLPVLEAMACGIPVISSDTSSLPELGGEAAFYFDPYDLGGMVDAIRAVWTDADLRADMTLRGLEQAAKFSWQRAADETLRVYEDVLGGAGAGQAS
jgi:glycosyltransferase involved in cell wall biosynthesis